MKTNEICNPNIPKYSCESCDYNTSRKSNYDKHLQTEKHFEKKIASQEAKLLPEEAKYFCRRCDFRTSNKTDYARHNETLKCKSVTKTQKNAKNAEKTHKLSELLPDDISSEVGTTDVVHETPNTSSVTKKNLSKKDKQKNIEFRCENCDYTTSVKSNYERHCQTQKCRSVTNDKKKDKKDKKESDSSLGIVVGTSYECGCGKTFRDRTGLWRHSKQCAGLGDNKLLELVISNQKQHDETIVKLVDMVKDISKDRSIINNNNTNCHNKQFNLQFFLNETCKDAYNISEFVEQLDVTMEDMLNTSRVGYTEGVSQIIVNGLKALDETKRPIHCTDVKREILYIKENDTWVKEDEDRPILLGAVKKIAGKNIKQISEWCKQHPNYRDSSSRDNDIHLKILCNVMQGGTDNEISSSFKTIFRNVATGTRIQKRGR